MNFFFFFVKPKSQKQIAISRAFDEKKMNNSEKKKVLNVASYQCWKINITKRPTRCLIAYFEATLDFSCREFTCQ